MFGGGGWGERRLRGERQRGPLAPAGRAHLPPTPTAPAPTPTPPQGSALYPNEVCSDFAFLPFGAHQGGGAEAAAPGRLQAGTEALPPRPPPAVGTARRAGAPTLPAPPPPATLPNGTPDAGGGNRKCVGDQFATMEATVALAMLLRRFTFRLVGGPQARAGRAGCQLPAGRGPRRVRASAPGAAASAHPPSPQRLHATAPRPTLQAVGMATGATIHTAHGLKCSVQRRPGHGARSGAAGAAAQPVAASA